MELNVISTRANSFLPFFFAGKITSSFPSSSQAVAYHRFRRNKTIEAVD